MKRVLLGPNAVFEAIRSPQAPSIAAVFIDTERHDARVKELVAVARSRKIPVDERLGKELDLLAKGERHQGVVAIAGEYSYRTLEDLLDPGTAPPFLVALDQITDPQNFGAIVRSAVAFGARGIITLRDRAAPVTAAVVRASAGATEQARIARVTNLAETIRHLREQGLQTVGLDADGDVPISELPRAPGGRLVVIGAEGAGLRRLVRERCEVLAHIPMAGSFNSLNASVAAAIALYEGSRSGAH